MEWIYFSKWSVPKGRSYGETEIEAKRRQLFYLNMTWFMTTLLDRKDRMSMGSSLEVRVPFADQMTTH